MASLELQPFYITYILVDAVVLHYFRRQYCACTYEAVGHEIQLKCMWDIDIEIFLCTSLQHVNIFLILSILYE